MKRFLHKFNKPTSAPPVSPGEYGLTSYSQEGEDMVLRRYLKEDTPGFYVDVGAHHPQRFSNTYYYYQKNWRGINIDADPDLTEAFNELRPRDINVSAAVGRGNDKLTFYIFNERAINTFDKKLAEERARIPGYKILEKRLVKTYRLEELLDKFLPSKQVINFMSVDVEGKDLDVLKSNNWSRYRPEFILVECLKSHLLTSGQDTVTTQYLHKQNYAPIAKTLNTVVFANLDTYRKS